MDYNNDDKSISNISSLVPTSNLLAVTGTGAIKVPSGTTLERPTLENGYVRLNTETGKVEISSGSSWVDIRTYAELPSGGTAGNVLIKNSSTDYDAYFGPITAEMAPYAKQLVITAKNDTNATILKGTPVYQTGNAGSGFDLLVRPADASDSAKMPAIGVLGQDLAAGATGDLIVLGEIKGVDTSAFAAGDLVYVAAGGGYTNVKPTSSSTEVQFLGIVTKVHATNGGGVVTGTGTTDIFRSDLNNTFYGWNGTSWVKLLPDITTAGTYTKVTVDTTGRVTTGSNPTTLSGYGITDAVNKAGDSMTGSLSLPKTSGDGILIDNVYGWIDIIGDVTPKTLGTKSASHEIYIGFIKAWAHKAGSYGDLLYHMPHQYAPNTDIFIHVHWGHNGTDISGTFKVNFWAVFAKRDEVFEVPIATSLTLTDLNITNTPQYKHRVDEILLSTPGGSSSLLNTSTLTVDGIISIHYEIDTIPSISGSSNFNLPYIHTIDIHMQTTNIGTKNKDPNFYA